MAEAVVGVLIGKLGAALANEAATYGASLLCKEASALKGFFDEIRRAKEELESMNAYLQESEKFKDTDKITGIFVNKIRELSFQIEDVVDEFMYKLEDDKHGGFAAKMKKRIKNLEVWHRLAHKLCDINAQLKDAAERRARYVIPEMHGYARSSDHHMRSTNQNLCFAREDDLVGIEVNATMLKQWLVGDLKEKNYKIATVWGMGGVGKTTLVEHVYNIVKSDFDAKASVTVSKSYQGEDLLKKIGKEFGITTDATNMEIRNLVDIIRTHLEGKRCILVLDDVWEKDVWINNVMEVFPTNCICRIVLTSRKFEVASLATSNCIIELEPLGDKQSWELFCRTAFRNSNDKRCPSELHDLAVKLLQKCEGLPIAVACLGRLLSVKQPTYYEWDTVYMELELQSNNNVMQRADSILKLSLEDLPYQLKNCFLHCALFPEDYGLWRRRLIRHWITCGFVMEKENETLEKVAEGYLDDLVNRSLLQVVMKNVSGRVKCCRMHDVIRHLALDKAAKECFGKVYEGHGTFTIHGTRRLSINNTNIVPFNQSGGAHLRAVYVSTSTVDRELLRSTLTSSTLLSILDLQGTEINMLPNEVFFLFNLRFLGLRNTQIKILPEAIGRLQNLEVLDAAMSCLQSLPKDVAKLKKLRYLYAYVPVDEVVPFGFNRKGGVKVPRGIINNLRGLHALQTVKASSENLCDVAALTDLRTFFIDNVTSQHSLILCRAVRNMSNLVSLSITMSDENEVLPLEQLCLPETLSKLELHGQLEKKRMPEVLSYCLKNLCLMFSKLDENSFPSLMVLRNLHALHLCKAYHGKTLCLSAQSFPKLRELYISVAPHLCQVEIEEDALGSLDKLWFLECPEMKCLPRGIEYLTTLDELCLVHVADELIKVLRQEGEEGECKEELMKISHIRMVDFKSTKENLWRRIVNREGNALAG